MGELGTARTPLVEGVQLICPTANQLRVGNFGCRVLISDFPKYFPSLQTQISS
jgi:hypothetical protein